MTNEPVTQPSEPPSEDVAEEFRIEGLLAVRAILRDLMDRRVPVLLYPERALGKPIPASVVEVDDLGDDSPSIELDVPSSDGARSALESGQALIGVALPQGVKIQFRLDAARLEDGMLRAPIPAQLFRIQRRDAFRVQPPEHDAATCVRRLPEGGEARYRLLDLSAGGASVAVPLEDVAPIEGDVWQHCRIETRHGKAIPCDLLVLRASRDPSEDVYRVALAFHALPAEVLRAIQIYVIDIEKRGRAGRG